MNVAVCDAPLRVAVTVAVPLEARVPVVAVKVAVVELVATVTEADTARDALFEDRETEVAAVNEALERVTVQELVALEARVVGEH